MQERKTKKCRVFVHLLIIFLAVSTYLPCKSFAGDMEILLDKLVSKGVLTKLEAESLAKEMKETKAVEKSKMEPDTTKTGAKEIGSPEWVKNLPDWIVNPPDWIKNIKFSGDFRLRYDRLDRQPVETSTADDVARNRARFRLRLGAETKVSDNVTVGFGIASSENGNPRSNNQSFNGEWSKKSISINYAYVAYTPFPWLTVSGGKLKTNPIFRANSFDFPTSGLLWDPDITPEGFSAVFNFPSLLKFDGVSLDVFMNNAFFILDEFSNGQEPYMFVFQPGFNLKIMKDINFKAAVTYQQFSGIKNQPLLANQPGPGNTNTLFTSGPLKGNYQFVYNAFNATGEFGYKTPFQDIVPYVGFFGEYVTNVSPDVVSSDAWTAGVRIGSPFLKKFGDWQLAYAYRRIDRDALLDIMPDDDFYQGQTNAKGHYIYAAFGLAKNISADVHFFHTVNILGAKQPEDRLLVHLLLKF